MSNTGVTITDLGPPDASGLAGRGLAVNEAGQVVGTILDFGSEIGGFLWANGVMTRLESFDPSAINDSGQVAGTCGGGACLWKKGVITKLSIPDEAFSAAHDLNNAGQIVGSSKTAAGQWHGFLWADGVVTDLGSIEPQAINERGQVAGWCPAFGFPMRACRWENGVITTLGTLGGAWSKAYDINSVGQVVGTSVTSTGQTHAFRWANGVMTDLGHLGRDHSEARAINDAGQVVGFGCIDGCEDRWETISHAFLWTNGVMTDLGTLGGGQRGQDWSTPEDINEAGQIAGASFTGVALDDENATGHAVLWTPAPGNTAPAVSGGPDQQVEVGQPVSLTFTFADRTPAGPWTWYVAWGQDGENGMAKTAGTATTANDPITVTHTYTGWAGGRFTVHVRVTDGNGGVGLDEVVITVVQPASNTPPTVTAGPDAQGWRGYETLVSYSFADTTPNDPWTQEVDWGDGTKTSNAFSGAAHVYATAGQYTVRVTVTDAAGAAGTDNLIVTIFEPPAGNTAPTVDACCSGQSWFTHESMNIQFNYSDRFTPAGPWAWQVTWGDGGVSSGTTPFGTDRIIASHVYSAAGQYTAHVTVTDNLKAEGSDDVTFSVADRLNTAPSVNAGADREIETGRALTMTFGFGDGTPNGPWAWQLAWGDGATSAGTATATGNVTASHTYAAAGQYTARVTVTDAAGAAGADEIFVTVTAPLPATGAITQTLLTAGTNTVNQRVYTTAAIAPAPNTLVTVAVLEHSSLGAPPRPTLSGGGMTAWEVVATTTFDTGALPSRRLTIFRAMSSTPGSGAITITSSMTLSHCQWIVSQWAGVETGGVNGAGAIRQTGSTRGTAVSGLTVPLAAFGHPNNVGYGVFGVRSSVLAVIPGAGFTEISEQPSGEGTPGDLEAEWATNRNTINATWSNLNAGALGVEIKAGGTGLPVPDASRSTVNAAPTSLTAGTGSSAITVTVKDAGGSPISGVRVVLSATGSGNRLTQPAALTDGGGVATGTLSSTVAGTKTVSATADGANITQTATVTVTAPPANATITQTLLTAGNNTINQRAYTTAVIAPAPNTLVTVAVLEHSYLGTPPSPTLSGGGMTAWEIVATTTFDADTLARRRLTIFRAMSAAPGSGALTITSSMTLSHCQWIVSQWGGAETRGVNGAGAIGQTGSNLGDAVSGLTVSLAAFTNPNNVGYGVFGVRRNVLAVTPGAGFTEISEQPSAESTLGDLEAEWAPNRNVIDATWTTLDAGALGVEIKARTLP